MAAPPAITVVWIADDALRAMEIEATARRPNETGGLLMGYTAPSQGAVVITTIVGPGPQAIHEPKRYVPDHDFHEQEVARLHTATSAVVRYLGDWHSHPGGAVALSSADRMTLRRIATAPEAGLPTPLMGILADGQGDAWRLGFWRASLERRYWLYRDLTVCELATRKFVGKR